MKRFAWFFSVAAATALLAGAAPSRAASVGDILTSTPEFSALSDFVIRGNMLDALRGSTAVTVFAPVNAAFDKVPAIGVFQHKGTQQTPDIVGITDVVREHIVGGSHPVGEFAGQRVQVTNAFGKPLVVDGTSGTLVVFTNPSLAGGTNSTSTGLSSARSAQVVGQPIIADNGMIYPIDNVLIQ